MSKKCCGMIYSDDEKICKVCGKPLLDEAFDGADVEETEAEESQADDVEEAFDDKKASDEEESSGEEASDETEAPEKGDSYDGEELSDEEDDYEPEDRHRTSDGKVDYLKKHIEREAILDQIYDDNGYKKNKEALEEKDKVPFKGAGIFTLIIAILGLALIGALVYFIVLNPYYIKSGEADKKLDYPQLASDTDAGELATLLEPYNATVTDADEE